MTTKSQFEALDDAEATMASTLDALTMAIRTVETALRTRMMNLSTRVLIPPREDESERHYLAWMKHDETGWSLHALTRYDNDDKAKITLLTKAPWRLRIRATECFDALLVQAALDLRHQNKEAVEAIARCEKFANKLKGSQ